MSTTYARRNICMRITVFRHHREFPKLPGYRSLTPPSTRAARRTRPYISTCNIPPVHHEPCLQGDSSRKQDPAVANFYSAAEPRSRGALGPSFALARIESLFEHDGRVRGLRTSAASGPLALSPSLRTSSHPANRVATWLKANVGQIRANAKHEQSGCGELPIRLSLCSLPL
jgi:hypothetical protein